MSGPLHPTEHRGYRELHAMTREIVTYWPGLAGRLRGSDPTAAEALDRGADGARQLIDELRPRTAAYGVHGGPRAHGLGRLIALGRSALRDPFLERNQALRFAVLDAEHVATLLAYLGESAERRSDEEMASFFASWERKVRRFEGAVRRAAVAEAGEPDAAIEPAVGSPLGRAGHAVSYVIGTFGEWSDRRAAEHRSG